ncbi:MAG: hypothetical protein IJ108_02705 [Eubacterium sp.]|nr:hypothetical protein [Eubacterium sp.]
MRIKKWMAVLTISAVMVLGLSACGGSGAAPAEDAGSQAVTEQMSEAADEVSEEAVVDATAYGYGGSDPVEAAAYQYMVEEMSKNYDEADVSIPTVTIVAEDLTNENDVVCYGDFWIDNYNIEGDTLKCVSGGNYPGVMHMKKDGEGYVVVRMDQVADGGDFDQSAKELFGDYYEDFMTVYSDSDARDELRRITVTDYVHFNGLSVTQFQDEGWDPVELYQ